MSENIGLAVRAGNGALAALTPALTPVTDWRDDAACRESDIMTVRGHTDEAREICASCAVFEDCRRWVMRERPTIPGIVAGLSPEQRGMRSCSRCQAVFPPGTRVCTICRNPV